MISVSEMDGSLFIMEGSLSRLLLLHWMVALSLQKVVCCRDFVTPLDGSLFIMEGSMLLRFCNSNRW